MLRWIIDRVEGRVDGVETPVGTLPAACELELTGLDIDADDLEALTSIDAAQWRAEMESIGDYLESYGERLPDALRVELERVSSELDERISERAA